MSTQKRIPKSVLERIIFFVSVAQSNNAAISLRDLLNLMPTDQVHSADQLEDIIRECLGETLLVEGGYVVTRGAPELAETTRMTQLESAKKIQQVKSFVDSHHKLFADTLVVAVSGSASYGSAKKGDDVDIFLITKNGALWSTLFKILLYIRVRRILRVDSENISNLCFSVIFTKRGFEELLKSRCDPLSARELINLKPVKGGETLGWYLANTEWIKAYYPRFNSPPPRKQPPTAFSGKQDDTPLSILLGAYLAIVAKFRNTLFRLQGREQDVFRVIRSRDKLVYESHRYVELRARYFKFFKDQSNQPKKTTHS